MEGYDHSQLKAGDAAAYSDGAGWGGWNQHIKVTRVDRLTATQIVMVDGTRFRRDTGRRVGSTGNGWLIDPKGEQMRNALGQMEASSFGYGMTQWDKKRRVVKNFEEWEQCLSELVLLAFEGQQRVEEIKKEMRESK